jgi:hypothetical protein
LTKRNAKRTSRKKRRKRLRRRRRLKKSSQLLNKFLMRLREKLHSPKLLKRDKRRLKARASRVQIFQLHSKSRKVARRLKIKRTPATIDEYELLSNYIV